MTENLKKNIQRRIDSLTEMLPQAMSIERFACARNLNRLRKAARRPVHKAEAAAELDRIEKRLYLSIERKKARKEALPLVSFPENLPINERKEETIAAIRNHQVLIVSGETGCGKSTQLPKMCVEAGRGIDGKIGCTQPRRIAAIAISARIAEELGEPPGVSVGYRIRFTDRTSPGGCIKVMTDGILLAEAQRDPFLSEYDTLIIDEAHERSLNIDFLLGILRGLTIKRPDLKVIITSATMDTAKFADAFNGAPVIHIEGRMFPVEVLYRPPDRDAPGKAENTFVDDAVEAVGELLVKTRRGDLLLFMPTEADILEACERIEGIKNPSTMVLPLFSRLSSAEQRKVFATGPGRRVVVATNVAETSLTIPGIAYVVDTGLARIPRYVPRTRTTIMPVVPISRSSADQRKGRCGRVQGGVCIRLYSEDDYESRPRFTPAEIQRANLAEVILRMLSLKLGDVEKFPFIDPPARRSISDGLDLLAELGAVSNSSGRMVLTDQGRTMARMPLDPMISRMILEAAKEGCSREIALIASALSIQDPRERPVGKTVEADRRHGTFKHPESDFLTFQNIWEACQRIAEQKGKKHLRAFCRENHLSYIRIREWLDIHAQISAIIEEQRLSGGPEPAGPKERYAAVHRSILSGHLSNIAQKKDRNLYRSSRGREVMVFPGSTLFNRGPDWIVAAEIVKTTRLFARTNARIEPSWLEALGGDLCTRSYLNPHWEKNRGEVRALEQVSLYGLVIEPGRPVSFGKIDPESSRRIFIRALVDGELKPVPPFLKHNLLLAERILNLEDKLRRRDIFAGEQAMEEFYESRLPDVCDARSLARLLRTKGGDEFLRMSEEDLTAGNPDYHAAAGYPDSVSFGDSELRFSYAFSPGEEQDGVTLSVPAGYAANLPVARLDWVVPGLLEEKVTALIKGLPKRYRRELVPVSRTVETLLPIIDKNRDESLMASVSRAVRESLNVEIPASAWLEVRIPDHLRMRLSIMDDKGREIAAGRNLSILTATDGKIRNETGSQETLAEARRKWERTGMTTWNFDDIPEAVNLVTGINAYPALVPEDGRIALRLFNDAAEAARIHGEGLKALFRLCLAKELKFIKKSIRIPDRKTGLPVLAPSKESLEKAVCDFVIAPYATDEIRKAEAFESNLKSARSELMARGRQAIQMVEEIFEARLQTLEALAAIDRTSQSNSAALEILNEIRLQLEELVPADFLLIYDTERIRCLPRYMRAMRIRAERGTNDVEKDTGKKIQLQKYLDALKAQRKQLQPDSSTKKHRLVEELRWMIEEFRISLFAQEIKTPYPVSAKRLDVLINELNGML